MVSTLQDARSGDWSPPWIEAALQWGPLLLAALVVALVVRALLRRRRYDAHALLGKAARRAVVEALVAAEKRTEGEIVPVVLERSDRHPQACWLAALVMLLVGSALLMNWLPWQHPLLLLACQIASGAVGWLLAWWLPDLRRLFVGEARATEVAEEQAVQEFHRHGLHKTKHATGVLLFVSLLERRVVVLGDEGIHAKVGDDHWTGTTKAVLEHLSNGTLRDGLIAAIDRCGEVLAEHFPAKRDDVNELEDRVIVRRE